MQLRDPWCTYLKSCQQVWCVLDGNMDSVLNVNFKISEFITAMKNRNFQFIETCYNDSNIYWNQITLSLILYHTCYNDSNIYWNQITLSLILYLILYQTDTQHWPQMRVSEHPKFTHVPDIRTLFLSPKTPSNENKETFEMLWQDLNIKL